MRRKIICRLLSALLAFSGIETLHAQGTAFTYQGRLNDGGSPANGNYDLQFTVYDAVTNGNAVSFLLTNSAVGVSSGLFVTTLDFGPGIFTGPARWLDIGVRTNGNTNAFTILFPRQHLTAVPYAIFANSASNLVGNLAAAQLIGTLPSAQISGTYSGSVIFSNNANSFNGTFGGNGAGLTNLNASQLTGGTVADARLSTNVALLNTNQTFTGSNIFTGFNVFTGPGNAFNGTFSGNGAGLTNLNASQLAGGTVADARLSTNVALLNTNQIFTGTNVFSNPSNAFNGVFSGDGANLTSLNASQLKSGTVADARLSTNVALLNASQTFTGVNTFTNSGSTFAGNFFGNGLVGWIVQSGTAVQAVSDTGYLLTSSQLTTVTLPVSPNAGDIVRISGAGAGGWKVKQSSGQSVLGNFSSFVNSFWNLTGSGSGNWTAIASSSDGTKLVASIFNGQIYVSTDSGGTWVGQTGTSGKQWQSVASSADGTKLVGVVNGSGIYTNAATGWMITGAKTTNWDAVASSADGTKLVATVVGGWIYTSTDSGSTWTKQTSGLTSGASWECVASSASGGTLIAAATSSGQIYVSIDSGQDWSAQSGTSGKNWQSVACSADGSRFAAAVMGGGIYTNSGAVWNVSSAPSENWASLAMSADGSKLAAVVDGGGIYTSSDYGVTWQQQTNASSLDWYSVTSSADGSKLAAAVNGGSIYVSQTSVQTTTTPGATGFITGGQGSAVELQYIGNNQFMPVSFAGTIWAY
jgi:hypothetical protein